jgi:uncharacterized protein involved in exopolysaccharide biosynthesis/Mrp family chromosome partitioning ATPase
MLLQQPDRSLPEVGRYAAATPVDLLRRLRRHWRLLMFLGGVFAAGSYAASSLLLTKQYTTTGTLAIDLSSFTIPELQGVINNNTLTEPRPLVDSEVLLLRSPALIRRVVNDLHLENDPEFNPTLRTSLTARLEARIRDVLPAAVSAQAVALGLLPPAPANRSVQLPQPVIEAITIDSVLHNLSVVNDGRSLVIVVQFSAESPQQAADVVNRLMQYYIAGKKAVISDADREAHADLNKRVEEVRNEVAALEAKIQEKRQQANLVQTRAGSVGQQEVEELSTALTKAIGDRAQLQANYQKASALARSGGVGDSSQVQASSTISTLRDREAAAERKVADLSETLGAGHPQLRSARAELASARSAIAAEARRVVEALGAQVQAATQHEADLRSQLAEAQKRAGKLASVQADLVQLEKDADARRTLYTTLLQRAEQTRTDKSGPQQVGARIVDQADVPIIPSSPRPKMAAGIGLIAGVAFGGFLSLLRRRDRETYATCDEIAADTGLATLVAIPRLSGRGRFGSLPDVVTSDPVSPAAEALRLLRTKLRFVGQGMVPRSLLFVSSRQGEGTSSIVSAFARLASIDGIRVLLLESDLHNPSLARLLGLPPGNGFVETLLGHEHWRDAIVPDMESPLECLLTCNSQYDSNRLLETTQLQNLLAEAREEYNFVVLDTQPVTLGAQALVLAHLVDLVVLVVEAGVTPHENVQNAIDAISATALQPPVIVLNKA